MTGPVYYTLDGYKHRSTVSVLAQMGTPALFFRYELSPLKIKYNISRQEWSTYFINICALVGGMFVVAGILESLLTNGIGLFSSDDKNLK